MDFQLSGFGDLDRRFTNLGAIAQREILSKALKVRAELVRDEARNRAPKGRTGKLAQKMQIRQLQDTDIAVASTKVGNDKAQFYGYFVHFGTGRGFDAAAARALGYPGISRSKRHNQRSRPFLTDAVRATESSSIAAVTAELQKRITMAENS